MSDIEELRKMMCFEQKATYRLGGHRMDLDEILKRGMPYDILFREVITFVNKQQEEIETLKIQVERLQAKVWDVNE